MGVQTEKYIRKPLYVDAVRVTAANFDDIITWCQGEEQVDELPGSGVTKRFIKVRVHNPKNPRQTKAFIGDWILYTERGYKVYTNKAFRAAFDLVEPVGEVAPEELEKSPFGVAETDEEGARKPVTVEPEHGAATGADPEFEGVTKPPVEVTVDEHTTPQGEPHEFEATPQAITNTVNEQQSEQPFSQGGQGGIPLDEDVRQTTDKRVLTKEEQEQMGPDAVRELISSGEAVLAQDLAESR